MNVVVIKGIGKGSRFILYDGMNSLGRDVSNRIRLLDPRVSRRQCKIRKIGRSLFLYDLGAKNGTLVNGEAVLERELKIGDEIAVGNTILKIVDEDYAPQEVEADFSTPSLLKGLVSFILGFPAKPKLRPYEGNFQRLGRRRKGAIWRTGVYTNPPEGRRDTIAANTDPD